MLVSLEERIMLVELRRATSDQHNGYKQQQQFLHFSIPPFSVISITSAATVREKDSLSFQHPPSFQTAPIVQGHASKKKAASPSNGTNWLFLSETSK
jgi:hypothetical protein